MTGVLKDPLLTSARWLLRFCQFMAIVVAAAVLIGAVVIQFNHARVLTELAAHSAKVEGWEVVAGIELLLVLVAAMAAAATSVASSRRETSRDSISFLRGVPWQ